MTISRWSIILNAHQLPGPSKIHQNEDLIYEQWQHIQSLIMKGMHMLIFQKVNIFLSQAKDYQETGIATQFVISCDNSTVVTQIKLQYFTGWYLPVCLDHTKCVGVRDRDTLILQMCVSCQNIEDNNYNTTHVLM